MNTTVEFLYDCPACGAERGPHRYDGDELVCTIGGLGQCRARFHGKASIA